MAVGSWIGTVVIGLPIRRRVLLVLDRVVYSERWIVLHCSGMGVERMRVMR